MQLKIYLPVEEQERDKVLEELVKKHKSVRLSLDPDGRMVADVSEVKQLETHPTTGLPILHD